jgi:hypothetical protein
LARLRHPGGRLACVLNGEDRKLSADSQNDTIDPGCAKTQENGKTTRVTFQSRLQANKPGSAGDPKRNFVEMLILRHRSAAAFLYSQDPLQTSVSISVDCRQKPR